ncbi:MAG: HAD family hydrolase [Sarcina sp.]
MDLYISDLDGTLLNSNREVSKYSKKELNKLITSGLNFTVATARTPGTVIELLDGLKINKVISLMNGVFLYDLKNKEYLKIRSFKNEIVRKILNTLESFDKDVFMYGIKNNHLYVYHKELVLDLDKVYFEERKHTTFKTFEAVKSYSEVLEGLQVVNFMILDNLEVIKAIYAQLSKIEGINIGYYQDVYDENCYFIEIHSGEASKQKSIEDLKELYKPSKVICFGDNLNDIPMFNVADEKYAVANALESLKKIATDVIDSNDEDGVVKFIKKQVSKK